MKALLKKLNIGALVALISVVTLTVSWKNYESKIAAPTWYQITADPSDPTNKEKQEIDGVYPGGTPSGSCNTSPGLTCAVLLDDELDPDNMPATVADAEDEGFTVTDHRQKQ